MKNKIKGIMLLTFTVFCVILNGDLVSSFFIYMKEKKEYLYMAEKISRVFLTGDLHGAHDMNKLIKKKFKEQKNLTKDDYLIILGDFGLVWDVDKSSPDEQEDVDYLNDKNFTTIAVLGNHENYDRIMQLPTVEMFGGEVWQYASSIFILKRGAVYTIAGKTFFTMGGAMSTDKQYRREGQSWWSQEIPSEEEFENGRKALEEHNYEVDYVLAHTCPKRTVLRYMNYRRNKFYDMYDGMAHSRIDDVFLDMPYYEARQDTVTEYFEDLVYNRNLEFKTWFFGHFHHEWKSDDGKFRLMYRDIKELHDA